MKKAPSQALYEPFLRHYFASQNYLSGMPTAQSAYMNQPIEAQFLSVMNIYRSIVGGFLLMIFTPAFAMLGKPEK